MSKAAELAALIGSQTALSNRNLIINGAMQVAQRGDSTGVSANGFYASDRFKTSLNSMGTWNVENSSDAPAGFSNSHKLTCTAPTGTLGAGDYAFCTHTIEAQNLQQLDYGASGAKAFTISFYVKSNKTGNASLEINQQDTDPVRAVVLQYTINAANTWEYKEITVAGDTSGVINNDNGTGFEILWWLRSGSTYTGGSHQTAWYERVNADRNASNLDVGATANDTWQVTGVSLEVGEQATPFEHRSYGDELARCQRYYEGSELSNPISWSGDVTNGNTYWDVISYTVEKRASPTITIGTEFAKNGFSGTPSTAWIREKSFRASAVSNSTTNGAYFVFAFTADAEL